MPFCLQPPKEFFPPVQPGEARLPGQTLSFLVLPAREEFS